MSDLAIARSHRNVPMGMEEARAAARSAVRRRQVSLSHQYAQLAASELLLDTNDGEAVARHVASIEQFQSEVDALNDAIDLFRFNFGDIDL